VPGARFIPGLAAAYELGTGVADTVANGPSMGNALRTGIGAAGMFNPAARAVATGMAAADVVGSAVAPFIPTASPMAPGFAQTVRKAGGTDAYVRGLGAQAPAPVVQSGTIGAPATSGDASTMEQVLGQTTPRPVAGGMLRATGAAPVEDLDALRASETARIQAGGMGSVPRRGGGIVTTNGETVYVGDPRGTQDAPQARGATVAPGAAGVFGALARIKMAQGAARGQAQGRVAADKSAREWMTAQAKAEADAVSARLGALRLQAAGMALPTDPAEAARRTVGGAAPQPRALTDLMPISATPPTSVPMQFGDRIENVPIQTRLRYERDAATGKIYVTPAGGARREATPEEAQRAPRG